jgi:hypothetical protein
MRCYCGRRATHVCGCDRVGFCRRHYFEHVDDEHNGRQVVLMPYARDREPTLSSAEIRREMQSLSRLE